MQHSQLAWYWCYVAHTMQKKKGLLRPEKPTDLNATPLLGVS